MSSKNRGLGKGLGALIPNKSTSSSPVDVFFPNTTQDKPSDVSRETSELAAVPGASFAYLKVSTIRANKQQPRTYFDEAELFELVQSIKEVGVLQPVVVRPTAGRGYELIMGERRLRATKAAGLTEIPAIIRDTTDDDLLRDALLENLHRSALNPLEEAAAYQQLLDDFSCSQEELARRIARSRPQISNTLRLLKLPAAVQRRVAAGVISAGHARALLSLENAEAMEKLAARIVAEGLSVRSTEELVSLAKGEKKAAKRPVAKTSLPTNMIEATEKFADFLDTSVKVELAKNKGRLTIEFAGEEDFFRILTQLKQK